ncbi:hypothetical protein BH11MYX1_BH11MYX1_27770 [soil metagenome]
MKAIKFFALVSGMLRIFSFFLPLLSLHRADGTATVTAMQLIKGLDRVTVAVDTADVDSVRDVEVRGQAPWAGAFGIFGHTAPWPSSSTTRGPTPMFQPACRSIC